MLHPMDDLDRATHFADNLAEFGLSALSRELGLFVDLNWPPTKGADQTAIHVMSVVEEVGEVARVFSKRWTGKRPEVATDEALQEELGDLLCNLLALIGHMKMDAEVVLRKAMEKWSGIADDPDTLLKWERRR